MAIIDMAIRIIRMAETTNPHNSKNCKPDVLSNLRIKNVNKLIGKLNINPISKNSTS